MGAWHAADLLYVFSTLDFNWRPFEETDYIISEQISDAIVAFAENDNPNGAAIPLWETDYKTPMSFDAHSAPAKWKTKENISVTFNGKGKTI